MIKPGKKDIAIAKPQTRTCKLRLEIKCAALIKYIAPGNLSFKRFKDIRSIDNRKINSTEIEYKGVCAAISCSPITGVRRENSKFISLFESI